MQYRNIRLHPVLRLLYLFFRILTWLGVGVLYRRRLVLGREHFRFDGPAIVIVNHPSTLMDVLNPGLAIHQEMFFLANYSMFKHPVANWLLRRLFAIPVMRKEDMNGETEKRDNAEAFRKSFEHLEKNGVLFIAAEGTSWVYRWIRPLKTGTARIALGVESRNEWQLGVKIIPIGLSYTAPHQFRGEVVVQAGAPVYAADWMEKWEKNQSQAIDDLTDHLENCLKNLSIHTRDEAGEKLVSRLEVILQNEEPLPQEARFQRSSRLAREHLDNVDLNKQVEEYWTKLTGAGIDDTGVYTAGNGLSWWIRPLLLLGLPFFTAGYTVWWLPCFIPDWIFRKMNIYIGYGATVKMLAGLFTFPLALWACWRTVEHFTQSEMSAWLAVVGMIALGYFTAWYLDAWRLLKSRRKAGYWKKSHLREWEALMALRLSIVQQVVSL